MLINCRGGCSFVMMIASSAVAPTKLVLITKFELMVIFTLYFLGLKVLLLA